mgnify:CR=1 FL=1
MAVEGGSGIELVRIVALLGAAVARDRRIHRLLPAAGSADGAPSWS